VKDGRGVRLTPAARLLLARADELFARWEEIRAEVAETEDPSIGALRLCGFSTAAATLLPYVVEPLRAIDPHCTVRIVEADPLECFDLLLTDDADIAVVVVSTPSLPPAQRSPIRPTAVVWTTRSSCWSPPAARWPALGAAARGRQRTMDPRPSPAVPTINWCKRHVRQPVSHPPSRMRSANWRPAPRWWARFSRLRWYRAWPRCRRDTRSRECRYVEIPHRPGTSSPASAGAAATSTVALEETARRHR
jgi:DNA-binding transcriptional LysR family regulator